MTIINYKDLDNLKPKASIMLYCTCAEKNQLHYLQKIQYWYKHYKMLHHWNKRIDFYVFNDGKMLHRNYPLDKKIIVVEFTKALGRQSNAVFPGWKRSFAYATKLAQKYRYFGHIENDCFIKKIDDFYKYLTTDDFVGLPHCVNYNIVETSCIIINNHDFLRDISKNFLKRETGYENEIFERQLIKFLPDYYNLGNALRLQRGYTEKILLQTYNEDFFCLNQIFANGLNILAKTLPIKKTWWQKALDKFKNRHYIIDVAGVIRLRVD